MWNKVVVTLQTIYRTIKILDCFTNQNPYLSLSEIARLTDIPPSTCRRILLSLIKHRLIGQSSETNKYFLGIYCLQLGNKVKSQNKFLVNVKFIMQKIVDTYNEAVYLALLKGNKIVYLDAVESSQSVQIKSNPGDERTLHSTGTGKLFLAYMREEELLELIAEPLVKYTENTITQVSILLDDLKEIKMKGHAISYGEHDPEIASVAIPIKNNSSVIAAIALCGPVYRLSLEELEKIGSEMKKILFDYYKVE